jgi:hypothetical protein
VAWEDPGVALFLRRLASFSWLILFDRPAAGQGGDEDDSGDGSHYPGREDAFQVKGRQSGKVASATFTVTG